MTSSTSPTKYPSANTAARADHFLVIHDLVKVYKSPAGDFTALKGLNAEIDRGEFIAVIGKSGSGKSTFINMLTGIDRPSSGEVWINGVALHTLNETQLAKWRGLNLGVVFQFFQLLPTLTLVENVMLAMELNHQHTGRKRRERAMYLLELVEMASQAHKLPSAVSGGQQQRVAIARALANDPPLIVADEPTGSLDSRSADQIFLLFEKLVSEGKTILVVTHDNNQVKHANRTIVISDGEIVNEYLVKALAALNQDQLVEVTHKGQLHVYPPNANIIRQGEVGDKFYIITRGKVDVLLDQPDGSQLHVNQLKQGQYFGEMALLGYGSRTATVRASRDEEVSVVALDSSAFNELTRESRSLRDELAQIVQKRLLAERIEALTKLDQNSLMALIQAFPVQEFPPEADIIRQGSLGESFYVLIEGVVDVILEGADGGETVINQLVAGQFFGEMALIDNKRRSATVRASSQGSAKVVELTHDDFNKLVNHSEKFREHLIGLTKIREAKEEANNQGGMRQDAHD